MKPKLVLSVIAISAALTSGVFGQPEESSGN